MNSNKWEIHEIPDNVIREEIYFPVTPNNMRAIARRGFVSQKTDGTIIGVISPHQCMCIVEFIIGQPDLMRSLKKACKDIGMSKISESVGWDINIGLERWLEIFAFKPYVIARDHAETFPSQSDWKLAIAQKLGKEAQYGLHSIRPS
jgi:hypothetical protein